MNKVFDGNVLLMVALGDTDVRDVVVFGEASTATVVNGSIGIAQVAGLTGENISVDLVGVYEYTCATADTVAVGDNLFWDGTELTTVQDTNTFAGKAWSAKAGAEAGTAQVKIG